jgi:tetrahydromethanopterin S-methyltransferase subunit F
VSDREDVSGWAVGFTVFAAVMMIMAGVWQALAGLIAIFENEFYVPTRNYLFEFDVTAWGWIHLIIGVLVAFAGWGLLSGQTWARVVGITLAVLSAISNFLFIPYYPFWSILIIAVDILVIWALVAHGRQFRELKQAEAEERMRR